MVNTFLPYACFVKSAKALDYKRLGKQRVEAFQIINILDNKTAKKGINFRCLVMKGRLDQSSCGNDVDWIYDLFKKVF